MRERGERRAVRPSGQRSVPRLGPPPGPPSCLGAGSFPLGRGRQRRWPARPGQRRPPLISLPPLPAGLDWVRRALSVRQLDPFPVPTRSADGRAVLPGGGPSGRAPAAGPCLQERSAPGEGEPTSALGRAGEMEMAPPGPRTPAPASAPLASFVKPPCLFSSRRA